LTKDGLVAFYDIRPGNAAGQFLQPWSPHGMLWELLYADDLVVIMDSEEEVITKVNVWKEGLEMKKNWG